MNLVLSERNGMLVRCLLYSAILLSLLSSCAKSKDQPHSKSMQEATVIDKWITLQLRLMRNTTGVPNQAFSRHFAYSGIAALEALAPALPAHSRWTQKWNGLTGLPLAGSRHHYYLPENVNAALAQMNRLLFPNASVPDKLAIDSLEQALVQEFMQTQTLSTMQTSEYFGRDVAEAVMTWAASDGSAQAGAAYTAPVGPGLWQPTPAGFAAPVSPYWGNNRPVIRGSLEQTLPPPPPAYSTQPGSPFYQAVKEVYDASQSLTSDQKNMALFWRDVPGVTSPGHWLSILQQVLKQSGASLEKAAVAYALTGSALNDALITCFKAKYQYNLVRPVTYIRNVMGHTGWNSHIGTPAHPEYPSAHASLSGAAAVVLHRLFSEVGSFTDHTYDYLGMPSRTYQSLLDIGTEAGQSRLYAGIHYHFSIDAGLTQGRQVADNILSTPAH